MRFVETSQPASEAPRVITATVGANGDADFRVDGKLVAWITPAGVVHRADDNSLAEQGMRRSAC